MVERRIGADAHELLHADIDRGVARIAIADGSIDIAPLPCTGVTGHEGDLLVLLAYGWEEFQSVGWYLARFPSFADAVERRPDAVYEMAPWGTRMTAHGDKVYFAWHSTDEFQYADIEDGAEFLTTPLEGYDDWIMGMDVTDDGKLVIAGLAPTGVLNVFDAETGAFERTVASDLPTSDIGAIDCTSGGAPE